MVQVFKFGGTCSSTKDSIKRLVDVTSQTNLPIVITLSAVSGVTNTLRSFLTRKIDEKSITSFINDLRNLHVSFLAENSPCIELIGNLLEKLNKLLLEVYYTNELTPRIHDLLLTFGERLIVLIVKEHFHEVGLSCAIVYPEEFLLTDGESNGSLVLLEESRQKAQPIFKTLLKQYNVIITPGFYGISKNDTITLLGKSGTDYTATILGYILDSPSVTIWKDVNGFMTADPRIVPNAHTITQLSYDEAAELSYFGATLLHSQAIGPSKLKNVPVVVRNIKDLTVRTLISNKTDQTLGVVKSISHMRNLSVIKVYPSITGNNLSRFTTISNEIKDSCGNIISTSSSHMCIAFLMEQGEISGCVGSIKDLGIALIDRIEVYENVSLICLVGYGVGNTPYITSRLFTVLANENIKFESISTGANPNALHLTVQEKDLNDVILAFHNEFFN
ncbi:MAG: aspartate kinase [Candidatus Kariarchaeaceae archaeon]|jgi:aspartate kinase